jgi:predicted MPP superfamily phosphohydrolase
MISAVIKHIFRLLAMIGIVALIGSHSLWSAPSALATVTQHEEQPGQILFKAKQTLADQKNYSWQAIAFRQVYPNRYDDFYLRLVGFPDIVAIDHAQPLILRTHKGDSFLAQPDSGELTKNRITPDFHVGQYNLEEIVGQLNAKMNWQAVIPIENHKERILNIPSSVIQEWQIAAAVGNR